MEAISFDDSSDSDNMKSMKSQLSEFGMDEENLSREEMVDLLKALNNSKTTAHANNITDDDSDTQNIEDADVSCISTSKPMKRRYLNVRDRRMPWCVLPSNITAAEKARTLAVYIKLMSINSYHQARQSSVFAAWPPPIQIVEESTRILPLRSTRSGRSAPVYAGFDDDVDLDFVMTKPKKRKVSASDGSGDGDYTNKVISLKRKTSKDENSRPVKEIKMSPTSTKTDPVAQVNKAKKNAFLIIED